MLRALPMALVAVLLGACQSPFDPTFVNDPIDVSMSGPAPEALIVQQIRNECSFPAGLVGVPDSMARQP